VSAPGASPAEPPGVAARSAAVLIPVKAFGAAKRRLSSALDGPERKRLAREMADHVLGAAGGLRVAVVCDDAEVAEWARRRGALVISEPGRGLNRAVEEGVDQLAALGFRQVIVAHADLPLAGDLSGLAEFAGVSVVPDRREDGTNVLCLPTGTGFRFAYGPASFGRHVAEAERLALPVRVVREPRLAWDVDVPADLDHLSTKSP
jgi:2-phospho-L-lactate guanylyltransferase